MASLAQPTTFNVTDQRPIKSPPMRKFSFKTFKKKKKAKRAFSGSCLEFEGLNVGSRSSQNYPACATQHCLRLSTVKANLTDTIMFRNALLTVLLYTLSQLLSFRTLASLFFPARRYRPIPTARQSQEKTHACTSAVSMQSVLV